MDIDKVLEKLRIKELNNMQQAACKAILGTNDDIVILSPTGSGKTLAYLLPSAHLVDDQPSHAIGRDVAFLQMVVESSRSAEHHLWHHLLESTVFLHGSASAITACRPYPTSHGLEHIT